jgi:hypothetical protein
MQFAKHPSGLACCEGCWGDFTSNDGSSAYDRSIADADALKDRAVGADECVFADVDRCDSDMVTRCEGNFMHVGIANQATGADKATISDMDAGVSDDS